MINLLLILDLVFGASSQAPAAFDASRASVSLPTAIIEIDTGRLKGEPARLAPSDDGSTFLRTVERDRFGNERGKNYVIKPSEKEFAAVDEEPPWAALYWSWKSGPSAPGQPSFKLDVEVTQVGKLATGSTVNTPDNPYRSDPSQSQAGKDWSSYQKVVTTTVKLKGQLISQTQNAPFAPGIGFGWAPNPLGAIAFVDAKKRLILMDRNGQTKEVEGASNVLLPCWTSDGKRILFLRKQDRKKYTLMAVDVQ
ncbi:MAG TPA: hypothetical protein VGK32_13480 [Vicinamibacterales bacterium]|jgi:hypothetical protein